jgi:DNA-binding GntR family transcriptional regulator
LWDTSDRHQIVVLRSAPAAEEARSEHNRILAAVIGQDAEAASDLMREHTMKSQARVFRLAAQ